MPTQTGAAPGTYTQVMSGQIDVGWAGAPFGVDAVEQGRTRVVAKASDDPVLDRQTIRLLIANSNEMAKRPDVFVRFMRAYREALDWVYSTPEGLAAYAKWANISEADRQAGAGGIPAQDGGRSRPDFRRRRRHGRRGDVQIHSGAAVQGAAR